MPFAQIPFLADDKLDVLGDEIDTVSQSDPFRFPNTKTRINLNDDWATLRPAEFNIRWPPAKAESSQTAQRNIADTLMLIINQRGRTGALTNDEIRWRAELVGANSNDLSSH
ncbi:hypothetical protein BAE40_13240 [Mesorhizobium loti]|nr:hypothetical protein BAE40_13240 [Mesorhizobium loti]